MVEIEMEERDFHPVSPRQLDHDVAAAEVPRSVRDTPPAHYILQIKSFSQLSESLQKAKADDQKYESADFEADGYKWKLVLYPYGNEKRNGNGHISLFLAMSDKNPFTPGWEVNVTYTFFVFNHVHDNYLVIPDGRMRRFHGLNTENGFPRLLPLSTFMTASNGYLLDDCCAFGVELLVVKACGKGETFSIVKEPEKAIFTWKLENFSTLNDISYNSGVFTAGHCQWKLSVYPKGDMRAKGSLSFFLKLHSSASINLRRKLYVEFKLSIKNQIGKSRHEHTDKVWLCDSVRSWGFINFISLRDLEDISKGFVVNDSLIFEAEIIAISQVKYEL